MLRCYVAIIDDDATLLLIDCVAADDVTPDTSADTIR